MKSNGLREKTEDGKTKTLVRKGQGELGAFPAPSHYCVSVFPSSLFSLKLLDFRHKLNFYGPPLDPKMGKIYTLSMI